MFADLIFTREDRPVLRFWNYTEAEFDHLVRQFGRLAEGEVTEIRLRLSKSTFGVDHAVFAVSADGGARIVPSRDAVVWERNPDGWKTVAQTAARVQPGSDSFQWLDDRDEVSVLLSPSGRFS